MNLRKKSTREEFERALAHYKPENFDGHTEFYRLTPDNVLSGCVTLRASFTRSKGGPIPTLRARRVTRDPTITEGSIKAFASIETDWKWGTPGGSRELDRFLDRELSFCEKLERLEEAETLSPHLRANRESHSNDKMSLRSSAG